MTAQASPAPGLRKFEQELAKTGAELEAAMEAMGPKGRRALSAFAKSASKRFT